MPPLVYSYAQNHEDLILAGMLKGVGHGFYVDIGANHPTIDSVTQYFYDRHWRGINVEPNPTLHEVLSLQRPRDINLQVGVGAAPGNMPLRCYESIHGLSSFTTKAKIQTALDWPSARYRDLLCPVETLATLLDRHAKSAEIHFLKLDVEGMELEVILGNNWRLFRPWLLCIERGLDQGRLAAAQAFLSSTGYQQIFYDGINDYWGRRDMASRWASFSYAGAVTMSGAIRPPAHMPPALPLKELLTLEGDAFIASAYAAVLKRQPDAAGSLHYSEALALGSSKHEVLRALAGSEEAQQRGLSVAWLQVLPTAGGRESLLRRGHAKWQRLLGRLQPRI